MDYQYNSLNLLSEVASDGKQKANYYYAADGTRLGVRDEANNGYDYCGSAIYKRDGATNTLESISFGNGRIIRNSGNFEVNYYLCDHLNNVRVVFDGNGLNLEQNDYYPFGERHAVAEYELSTTNRFKFNGKERQTTGDLDYLDYGARMYDSRLGRWFVQDPLAENYFGVSPYAYCANNPVKYIDPNGMIISILTQNANGDMVRLYWERGFDGWGFYHEGKLYLGMDLFVNSVSDNLKLLMNGGKTGSDLVEYIVGHNNELSIERGTKNSFLRESGPNGGKFKISYYSGGIPNGELIPTVDGKDGNVMFTILGHELAHVKYNWDGGADKTWFAMTSLDKNNVEEIKKIHQSEKFTTHIENKIRKENNLSLRKQYVNANSNYNGNRGEVLDNLGRSYFFNKNEGTSWKRIKNKDKENRYKY